jgi:hypothetical protein
MGHGAWGKILQGYVDSGLKGRITTTLSPVVKIRNWGKEKPVGPDKPQKSLPDLGKSLKAPSLHLYLKIPPNHR